MEEMQQCALTLFNCGQVKAIRYDNPFKWTFIVSALFYDSLYRLIRK